MKQQLFRFAILGALLAAACKRSDDTPPDTNATRIVGSWRESYRAIDSNGNGQADSSERFASSYYRMITFYANGSSHDTLFTNGVASSTEAAYTVDGDFLSIAFPGISPSRILQLDAGVLLLSDTSMHPALITGFNRQ